MLSFMVVAQSAFLLLFVTVSSEVSCFENGNILTKMALHSKMVVKFFQVLYSQTEESGIGDFL